MQLHPAKHYSPLLIYEQPLEAGAIIRPIMWMRKGIRSSAPQSLQRCLCVYVCIFQ